MGDHVERKKLSNSLFAPLFALSLFSFLAATAIVVAVSWSVYEGSAEELLSSQAEATASTIAGCDTSDMITELSTTVLSDTRITLVSEDGTVLYDNVADPATMGNHGERGEIVAARKGGDSVVLRRSETTGTDMLYAAVLVDSSGTVLRLSEARTSLVYYLGNLVIPLTLVAILAIVLSLLISRAVAKRVASPLLAVDLEDPLQSEAYAEVEPLLVRIDAQRNELIKKNEQLERSVAMRREFTGNVSHEMKSPLQVIGGYAELIESGIAKPEDSQRFAALIRAEAQSMRTLIDDLLTLSRLDEGSSGQPHSIDLSAMCEHVLGRLSSSPEAEGVIIELNSKGPVEVKGSEPLVEQIVYNLVDNAMRYGDGRVEVSVEKMGDSALLYVSDNGPGIPEELRMRVFERFYRVDPSRSRETGGTGLGLAIVKHAVETMDGTIVVGESDLGGALFSVALPSADK